MFFSFLMLLAFHLKLQPLVATVYCSDDYSCDGDRIAVSEGVSCLGDYSCQNSHINVSYYSSFMNIECEGDYSCRDSLLKIAGASGSGYLRLYCDGDYSCADSFMLGYLGYRYYFYCLGDYSCLNSSLTQRGASSSYTYMYCEGDESCRRLTFNMEDSPRWYIYCRDYASCSEMEVVSVGDSDRMNFYCQAPFACAQARIGDIGAGSTTYNYFYCEKPHSCKGITTGNIAANSRLSFYCDDYLSCGNVTLGDVNDNSYVYLYCYGYYSCPNTLDINVRYHNCYGQFSCIGTNEYKRIYSNSGYFYCEALGSCMNLNIGLNGSGNTYFNGDAMYAFGNTRINSTGSGSYISLYLDAFDSGYNLSVICGKGDSCYISCYGGGACTYTNIYRHNETSSFYVWCNANWTNNCPNVTNFTDSDNIDQIMAINDAINGDFRMITSYNETYLENEMLNARLCDREYECGWSSVVTDYEYVYCRGAYSCNDMVIVGVEYEDGSFGTVVECGGDDSCDSLAILDVYSVFLSAQYSGDYSAIVGVSNVYFGSIWAWRTRFISDGVGTMNVYNYGYDNWKTQVHCTDPGDTCNLYCYYDSCKRTTVTCEDEAQCNIFCDEQNFLACPRFNNTDNVTELKNVFISSDYDKDPRNIEFEYYAPIPTFSPTSMPTSDPTSNPTMVPTVDAGELSVAQSFVKNSDITIESMVVDAAGSMEDDMYVFNPGYRIAFEATVKVDLVNTDIVTMFDNWINDDKMDGDNITLDVSWIIYDGSDNKISIDENSVSILSYNQESLWINDSSTSNNRNDSNINGVLFIDCYFVLYSSQSTSKYSPSICSTYDDDYFESGNEYTVDFQILLELSNEYYYDANVLTARKSSHVDLLANSPPESGTCMVYPERGTVLIDTFTFICDEWSDSDSNLTYNFLYDGSVFLKSRYDSMPMVDTILGSGNQTITAIILDDFKLRNL